MKKETNQNEEEGELNRYDQASDRVQTTEPFASSSATYSAGNEGLILEIGDNNGEKEMKERKGGCGEDKHLRVKSASLGDISTSVVRCSLSSLPFSSIVTDSNSIDRRKYRRMATYFNHLMDRLIRSGDDWMIVNSAFEKKIYDNYHEVVQLLYDKEIIEAKNSRKFRFSDQESYCRSYRLNEKYRSKPPELKLEEVETASLVQLLEKQKSKPDAPVRYNRLRYLKKLMLDLTFDESACEVELKKRVGDDQTLLDAYNKLVAEDQSEAEAKKYLEEVFGVYVSMGELLSLFHFLREFNQRSFRISQSRTCQRLTSIYVQLASRWRKYLRWQGQRMIVCDISCCHAPMWISTFATGKEKEILTKAYEAGKFYDLFVTDFVSRSFIKKQFQSWMNGDRYDVQRKAVNGRFKTTRTLKTFGSHPLDKVVATVAPDFAQSVRSAAVYGKKERSKFACLNMKIEAAIMVDQMLDWASDTNTVYFPIHDGWMTVPGHGERVAAQVKKLWHHEFNMTPHITKEGSP